MQYGTWAVIAGASEGIGAAFARSLAAQGYSLLLIARRTEPLATLAAELRGTKVETLSLDLGAEDLEEKLREIASSREVGVLVYNAALAISAPFLDTPIADKLRALNINARGPLVAAHVFGEAMAARGRGAIVLMSSLTAFWGSPWVATYGATKAFNLSLGEALAAELGERGVEVIVSCAGATSTPGFLQSGSTAKAMTPEAVAKETLAALGKTRGMFVPGGFNRFAQWLLSRLLPRRIAVGIMGGETRKLLRDKSMPAS
jgi:short-subunit dehydrogenase